MKKAIQIKQLTGWTGNAILYKLSEPLSGYDYDQEYDEETQKHFIIPPKGFRYVVVSAISNIFGLETFIFGVDGTEEAILKSIETTGDVNNMLNMSELPGSYRNDMNHETALNGAGYTLL